MNPTGDRGDPRTVPWLRVAIVVGILVAALRPTWPGPVHEHTPLLVLDVSESMGTAGVAPSGAATVARERLLFADGVRLAVLGEDDSALSRGRTRTREALERAAELLGDSPGVAWLVTDGLDTEGGAIEGARALARRGHRLYVSAPDPVRVDVGLLSARLGVVSSHAPVEVRARVAASAGGAARVALRRGLVEVDAGTVVLAAGIPRDVVLRDPEPLQGTTVYEVALSPLDGTPDDDLDNDRLTLVAGLGDPLVLVVDAEPWGAISSAPRLRMATTLDPAVADTADLIVLSNVAWRRIREGGAERLARLVAGGATLLVLGGPDGFDAGGWRGTAFERLLPLRSPREPSDGTALAIALDRSGSTGEATPGGGATALSSLLRALDELVTMLPSDVTASVLPFAGVADQAPLEPGWVRGGDASEAARLLHAAKALTAGGGTDLDEAIVAAARTLTSGPPSKRRRVLLLCDGDPDHTLTPAALSRARGALAAAGAQFSAVVRGDSRAVEALRSLAVAPEDVTQIDIAGDFPEALLAAFHRGQSSGAWVAGPLLVEVKPEAPELAALASASPARIHRVELAEGATLLARAHRAPGSSEPDGSWPLIAERRLGAGVVVASAAGPALETGASREGLRGALGALIARLAGQADRGLAGDEEDGQLVVEAPRGLGALEVVGATTAQRGTLIETSPGVYAGPRPPSVPGDEPLLVLAPGIARRPIRMPTRPPIEHRIGSPEAARLTALAAAGRGARLAQGEGPPVVTERVAVPLAPWILLASLVLFLRERGLHRPAGSPPRARSSLRTPT